jgi:outer membrane protein TolC
VVVFPNIQDNWRLRAGVVMPIWTGGRIGGQITAAEQGARRRREDLRAGRADLVLETKSAYWSLVTARESRRVVQEAIRAYDAHLQDARNRERFGMAARNEVLAVEVERTGSARPAPGGDGGRVSEANLRRLLDLAPGSSTRQPLAANDSASEIRPLVAQRRPSGAEALAARRGRRGDHRGRRGSWLPQLAVAGSYLSTPTRHRAPRDLGGHLGRGGGAVVEPRPRETLGERARAARRRTRRASSCASSTGPSASR